MNNMDSVRKLVGGGLCAVAAASQKGGESVEKIMGSATNSKLKEELRRGRDLESEWQKRIKEAQASLKDGSAPEGTDADSHIIDAIYKTGREIVENMKDAQSRDLGIVSTGQLALHYYIAAFGSLENYASHVGEKSVAEAMKLCKEEAKSEDEKHSKLAQEILAQ